MSKQIVAIYAMCGDKKKWVESIGRRHLDKKYAVTLTQDVNSAHDFEDMRLARDIIPSINNPFDRDYQVEKTKATQTKILIDEDMR